MDEELAGELLRRRDRDQKARREAWPPCTKGRGWSRKTSNAVEALRSVDEDNTTWLKRVVRERGWPGRSLVGEEGASAAWLLVQHADQDPAFQRECLPLLEKAVESGEASVRNLAYLTDRVLRGQGLPQRYGTQFTQGPDGLEPQPMEDRESVDERRARVSLGPLEEYRGVMLREYGEQAARSPAALGRPLASCSCGPLEVRLRLFELSRTMRLLFMLGGGRFLGRPQVSPVEPGVPLPWLPEGCSPCRAGPSLGATRRGKLVLVWSESSEPFPQPVEVPWLKTIGAPPRLEPGEIAGRPVVWIPGGRWRGHTLIVMTESGWRYTVLGNLSREELTRVVATLPG